MLCQQNQKYARQSLITPIPSHPELRQAFDINHPNNSIDDVLNGTYMPNNPSSPLSEIEREWIMELQQKIAHDFDINILQTDFIQFFKRKQEKTSPSISGWHIGHYKSITIAAQMGNHTIVDTLVLLTIKAIEASTPLHQWQSCAQVVLEKGKENHIENLHIIQLCEADLNVALHILWGHQLIHNAKNHKALNSSQYSLPGLTCQSAIWNKVLFCNLLQKNCNGRHHDRL
jgi:hypothetical protein